MRTLPAGWTAFDAALNMLFRARLLMRLETSRYWLRGACCDPAAFILIWPSATPWYKLPPTDWFEVDDLLVQR